MFRGGEIDHIRPAALPAAELEHSLEDAKVTEKSSRSPVQRSLHCLR